MIFTVIRYLLVLQYIVGACVESYVMRSFLRYIWLRQMAEKIFCFERQPFILFQKIWSKYSFTSCVYICVNCTIELSDDPNNVIA